MNNPELQEILDEFVTEAEEGLEHLEQNLITLENMAEEGEYDSTTVDDIFRALHTLKGGAGFLGLVKMQELAHAGENLLDEIRSEKVEITTHVMDALFKTTDLLKDLLEVIRDQDTDDSIETEAITATLKVLASQKIAPKEDIVLENIVDSDIEINQDLIDEINNDPRLSGDPVEVNPEEKKVAKSTKAKKKTTAKAKSSKKKDESDVEINQELLDEINNDPLLNGGEMEDQSLLDEVNNDSRLIESTPVINANPEVFNRRSDDRRKEDRRKGSRRKAEMTETTIRVETGRLDQVMNLVGELVLARNSLVRQLKTPESQEALRHIENSEIVVSNLELLSRVTQDLQKSVLHTRMQPIKKVFDKIPRQVRELKAQLDKGVNLIIEGEMTEVDKTLVEELSDPMVHLIRNALDHGIEARAERLAAGKDPDGNLIIRAFYEGNNIVIQVAEDGKGMDAEKIKAKAVERGILDENQAIALANKDAYRLVLEPGFSTAEKISDVSGRGVGMDVVNTKITSIKGSIDIDSELGKGTTISMYVPLTLAIVQALIVRAGLEGFAIPIGSISEVISYEKNLIHEINGSDVIEVRGEVIPLFYLKSIARNKDIPEGCENVDDELRRVKIGLTTALAKSIKEGLKIQSNGYIIIVRDANMVMGVCIDALIGQEEAVVKSITDSIHYNPAISGATITGDGGVNMILDIPYLMRDIYRHKTVMK